MKNLLFISVLLLFAVACNDKYDSLYEAAPTPALRFSSDTLFIREKDPTNINASNKGMIGLYCSPAGRQFNLSYSEASGKIHFSFQGQLLQDSKPFVVTDEVNTLYCYADEPGTYAVDFYLTDQLGKTITRKLVIRCMPGQKPVAALTYEISSRTTEGLLYYFNGDGSSQPFGSIVSYHYEIDGQAIQVNRPVLKYVFHTKGDHDVSFFVVDDLGQLSDTLHYTITIP